ncbi:ABC transporter permease [Fulvivirgaceae bacterium BMA10]|uniref:ABC transporter permease n=1 Tax=Splendidivirga corallicola TaxID=3051826 RepID=A0ABT8KKL9_9BACT|nr:ABC transporter permease [Fulvivirgaceae bacterium BMA10]
MKNRRNIPPKLADQFLSWFCKEELLEEIQGDLHEYYEELIRKPKWKRNLFYWFHMLNFLRPFAIKKSGSNNSNHIVMIQHNFKIARRNLLKQKMYSAINIGGYALGIAACLLIALFIQDELNYDKHYTDGDRIFRLVKSWDAPGDSRKGVTLAAPIKHVLESDFPEIEKAGRLIIFDFYNSGNNQFRPLEHSQSTYEEGFVYADPEILEILEIPMVYGEQSRALTAPNTMVISKRKADKYFPDQNPVGQIVLLNEDDAEPYKIGGVMENFPSNSHLQSDFLLTLSQKEFWPGSQTSWGGNVYDSYIKLKEGADPVSLEPKLLSIRDNYLVKNAEKDNDPRMQDIKQYLSFQLQSIKDIYLSNEVLDHLPHGDTKIVRLFGFIAGFILLLACINFINLSTARSANRAKEVGLRKVVGSNRNGLISQFITESLVFSGVSFMLGAILAWISLPYFNLISDKSLVFPWSEWWWLLPLSFISIGITGVLAGFYPALYLSAFKPIDVLKGSLSRGSKSVRMRSSLVIFQFTTSIVLIICTFIIYQQTDFILNTKIGYDKEQVIMLQGAGTLDEKRLTFKNELLRIPEVSHVTQSSYLPVKGTQRNGTEFWIEERSKVDIGVESQVWRVDQDYISTLGMQLVEGRSFSTEMASDSAAIIINQTLAKKLGLKDPIGKRVKFWYSPTYHIIGVLEDFYFKSIKQNVEPLALIFGQGGTIISVKVETQDMSGTLASISSLWKEFMPIQPIRYTFLDDSYERMYMDVERTGKVLTAFAILAIVVACLGLFALSAFMVEQRSKEISVRKVLGASLSNIFSLITFNFLKLVLISLVIAVPLGWYIMHKWLEDYANRIKITWEVFVIAGIIATLIALLTISSESIKAALVNPARKLRSE